MTIEIRKYQTQDLEDLLTAWESASRLAHPFMADSFFIQERENIPKLYIPNTDTWVVTADKKVVGFIALIVPQINSNSICEIGGLFVTPSFHGQKLGKTLVNKAIELYGNLSVKVFKDNDIGSAFYHRYGFQKTGEIKWQATGDILLEMLYSIPLTKSES
jgi:putative acetyltransferase